MGRYLLYMSYIGSRYRGAQKHNVNHKVLDTDSIQGAIEAALAAVLRPASLNTPVLYLSSRTDAGVHALSTTAHVDLQHPFGVYYHAKTIARCLNKYFMTTNHDIRITSCLPVNDEFHARYSARSRSYLYRFMVSANEGNEYSIPVAELDRCYFVKAENFDIERVKQATKLFLGKRDFRTFVGKTNTTKDLKYVRSIDYLTVEKGYPYMPQDPASAKFHFWDIKFVARSFLYNQVRRIVGVLLSLGKGKITERDIRIMLEVPSRHSWDTRANSAPAVGLYLHNVSYDPEELANSIIK